MMNIIRQFIRDLLYMPRYLFFRIYFGKVFMVVALYLSVLMFASTYTHIYKDFKIYKGNLKALSFSKIDDRINGYYMAELKLTGQKNVFESFAISKEEKFLLESKLYLNSIFEIHTPRIAPHIIFSNRKINLIKDENGIIIHKYLIEYKHNFYSGIFSLLFAIWLFWISSKR